MLSFKNTSDEESGGSHSRALWLDLPSLQHSAARQTRSELRVKQQSSTSSRSRSWQTDEQSPVRRCPRPIIPAPLSVHSRKSVVMTGWASIRDVFDLPDHIDPIVDYMGGSSLLISVSPESPTDQTILIDKLPAILHYLRQTLICSFELSLQLQK